MYVCIFLQHYRIHMDIGNSNNYSGIPMSSRMLFTFSRCVSINQTGQDSERCPVYSGFRFTGAQFQSTSRGLPPENRPVYIGFRLQGVRFIDTHLYIEFLFGLIESQRHFFDFENEIDGCAHLQFCPTMTISFAVTLCMCSALGSQRSNSLSLLFPACD